MGVLARHRYATNAQLQRSATFGTPSHQNFHQGFRFGGANVAVPLTLTPPPEGSNGSVMVGAVDDLGGKLTLTVSFFGCGLFPSGSSSSGPSPTTVRCGGRGGGRLPDGSVLGCESSFSMLR